MEIKCICLMAKLENYRLKSNIRKACLVPSLPNALYNNNNNNNNNNLIYL